MINDLGLGTCMGENDAFHGLQLGRFTLELDQRAGRKYDTYDGEYKYEVLY
jgi:hypothetical protein